MTSQLQQIKNFCWPNIPKSLTLYFNNLSIIHLMLIYNSKNCVISSLLILSFHLQPLVHIMSLWFLYNLSIPVQRYFLLLSNRYRLSNDPTPPRPLISCLLSIHSHFPRSTPGTVQSSLISFLRSQSVQSGSLWNLMTDVDYTIYAMKTFFPFLIYHQIKIKMKLSSFCLFPLIEILHSKVYSNSFINKKNYIFYIFNVNLKFLVYIL